MLLLWQSVYSFTIITSQYMTEGCKEAPAVIYSFDLQDLEARSPREGKEWPSLFDYVNSEYPITKCGLSNMKQSGGCCYNLLDEDLANGYKSVLSFEKQGDLAMAIPQTTRDKNYCILAPASSGSFNSISYLANQCVEGVLCKNGKLEIYEDANCQVQSQIVNPGGLVSRHDMTFHFDGATTHLGGELTISWTAYTPSTLLVPDMSRPYNQIVTAAYVISISILLALCILKAPMAYFTRRSILIAQLVNYTTWLIWTVLMFGYWLVKFDDMPTMGVYRELMTITFNFATLLSLSSVYSIFVSLVSYTKVRYLLIGVILFLHLAFAGGNYLAYLDEANIDLPITAFVREWIKMVPLWVGFVLFCNLFWTLMAIRFVYRKASKSLKAFKIWKLDSTLAPCVLLQILIFLIYAILKFIKLI